MPKLFEGLGKYPWVAHLSLALMVLVWLLPTLGLFVSSFRTADQISTSGWWSSMIERERQIPPIRLSAVPYEISQGKHVMKGNLFRHEGIKITAWGISSRDSERYKAGDRVRLREGLDLDVSVHGDYVLSANKPFENIRLPRVFVTASFSPEFTLENYRSILFEEHNPNSMVRSFFNTLAVAVPATILPILLASFAAYALAWMKFVGRAMLVCVIVGLLVVPLQLTLIPVLRLHNTLGIGKGYIGVWLAHTGFGLPLAVYIMRNYMVGLPREMIDAARMDGASELQLFMYIVLPLSFPVLASFAVFQFLWTWNDLLIAMVFLTDATGNTTVMTKQIVELMGTYGGHWEVLAAAAFISISFPLVVFFTLQKYLVRGLSTRSL